MSETGWVIQLINSVGFPIFVCLWFMFRTEKIIARNTEALQALAEALKS